MWRSTDDAGEVPLAVHHSHSRTAAWPSARDVDLASMPETHFLIVSTSSERDHVRAFRDVGGVVVESELVTGWRARTARSRSCRPRPLGGRVLR